MKLDIWAEDVLDEYLNGPGTVVPEYIEGVSGPMREFFPSEESTYQEIMTYLPNVR